MSNNTTKIELTTEQHHTLLDLIQSEMEITRDVLQDDPNDTTNHVWLDQLKSLLRAVAN